MTETFGAGWTPIHKGDARGRALADRHYSRQTPGHPMWTRPGYNACLLVEAEHGSAVWVWWRPKWEDGRPGTARKDGLRVLECTLFRREGRGLPIASDLIRGAVAMLGDERVRADLHLTAAGQIDSLITGVSTAATRRRRSKQALPGACYLAAGWEYFQKRGGKADVWLRLPMPPLRHARWCAGACGDGRDQGRFGGGGERWQSVKP